MKKIIFYNIAYIIIIITNINSQYINSTNNNEYENNDIGINTNNKLNTYEPYFIRETNRNLLSLNNVASDLKQPKIDERFADTFEYKNKNKDKFVSFLGSMLD